MAFIPVEWDFQEVVSSSKLNQMAANDDDLKDRLDALAAPLVKSTPVTTASTATATEVATAITLTMPTVPGAEYELRLSCRVQASVADLRSGARIRRGATLTDPIVGEVLITPSFPAVGNTVEYTCYDTAVAGSTTWLVTAATLGGTGTTVVAGVASAPAILSARRVS